MQQQCLMFVCSSHWLWLLPVGLVPFLILAGIALILYGNELTLRHQREAKAKREEH